MALEDFLRKERTEGRVVGGESAFTLDPNKVRERVAVFSEADTLYPLLRCLQALIRVSDSDIFGSRKAGHQWEFSFRWPGCPEGKAFEQLLNLGTTAGFDQVGHRVGQHLFFGLSAALGTPHYHMIWKGPSAHFELKHGEVVLLEPEPSDFTVLSFHIETNWWQRLTRQDPGRGSSGELRRRLSFSPRPIHLDKERLLPQAPQAPERPWAAKLIHGSDLAWRFIRIPGSNFMAVPSPELDYYRSDKHGNVFHLFREPEERCLPLSVTFKDRNDLSKENPGSESLSESGLAHSAVFLSLEAGRQDWLIPMADGVLGEPVAVSVAGGGIVCVTSEPALSFDLSGFKVVENSAYEAVIALLKKESKALKKQLLVTLANIGARADHLPKRYDQAACYVAGGPYLGMLGGRFIPQARRIFGRSRR